MMYTYISGIRISNHHNIYIYTNMSNVSLKLDHRNHVHGEVDSWNGGLRLQAPNPRVKRSLENSPCMPCFFQEGRGFCQIVLWTVWPPGHTRRRLRPFSWGGPRAGLGGLFDPSAMKHG